MDLSYLNSRARCLRGKLVPGGLFAELAASTDSTVLAERLRHTSYGPHLSTAAARYGDGYRALSAGLASGLEADFKLLRKVAPDGARALLDAYFVLYETEALKAVVRGIARGVARDELWSGLTPAGRLDRGAMNTLVHARDIPDLIAWLETWGLPHAGALREGLEAWNRDHTLVEFEVALDRFGYASALELARGGGANARIVREDLAARIDGVNLATLLKTAGEGFTREGVASLFINGGTVGMETFFHLTGFGSRTEVAANLLESRTTALDGVAVEALREIDPEDPASYSETVSEAATARLAGLALMEPLSIAVPVSYLFAKSREVRNLRTVARAVEFSIPPARTQDLLIRPRRDVAWAARRVV